MTVKLSRLTPHNVRALRETCSDLCSTITSTSATFHGDADQALTALRRRVRELKETHGASGHPVASLHAPLRKLDVLSREAADAAIEQRRLERERCGWCGETLEACTRCRSCEQHGSIVDGTCLTCGAVWDEEARAAALERARREAYADAIGEALEPADETTVHVPLDASTALEILRALDVACGTGYVEGETRAVLLGTLGAIRDGVIAAGVEVPGYVYLRTVQS